MAEQLVGSIVSVIGPVVDFVFPDGRLPEIYDAVLETARNIQETSVKIEPMVNDLRLFADSIARNPGAIVRGAIGPAGKTNYKGSAGWDGGMGGPGTQAGGRYR